MEGRAAGMGTGIARPNSQGATSSKGNRIAALGPELRSNKKEGTGKLSRACTGRVHWERAWL